MGKLHALCEAVARASWLEVSQATGGSAENVQNVALYCLLRDKMSLRNVALSDWHTLCFVVCERNLNWIVNKRINAMNMKNKLTVGAGMVGTAACAAGATAAITGATVTGGTVAAIGTAGSVIGGAVGAVLGSSVGIVTLGTGFAGTIPLAIGGSALGGSAATAAATTIGAAFGLATAPVWAVPLAVGGAVVSLGAGATYLFRKIKRKAV